MSCHRPWPSRATSGPACDGLVKSGPRGRWVAIHPQTSTTIDNLNKKVLQALIEATYGCRLSCSRFILVTSSNGGLPFWLPHPRKNHGVVEEEAWALVCMLCCGRAHHAAER